MPSGGVRSLVVEVENSNSEGRTRWVGFLKAPNLNHSLEAEGISESLGNRDHAGDQGGP